MHCLLIKWNRVQQRQNEDLHYFLYFVWFGGKRETNKFKMREIEVMIVDLTERQKNG